MHGIGCRIDDLHAKNIAKVPEASLGFRSQKLDAAEMGNVMNRLVYRHGHVL
jgi:hypothetical protein